MKGPLKPLPGRTPFLSPSPLVYILDQPRPSATSPPIPPLPGPQQLEVLRGPPSSVWRRQASLRLALSVHLLATARCGSPFGHPPFLSALLHHLLPSFAPCSLLPARQPLCAQPLSPAKPSARRYPRSQKALITSGPRAAIQHGQLPPASRERHSQPHSATLISCRRRAGTSTY